MTAPAAPADQPPRAPRLAKLRPHELDPSQREVYDAIAGGPRAQGPQAFRLVDDEGGLEGPFNALLLQPALGHALQAVGAAVRYETSLADRAREVAVLVVADHWRSAFEWYAHEAVGRRAGLGDVELAGIRDRTWAGLDETEALVARTTTRLAVDGDLDDATYAEVVAALGVETVFELATLVGYYATLALQLRVFGVGAPTAT